MYKALITAVLLAGYLASGSCTLFKSYIAKIGFRNKQIETKCQWNHSDTPSLLKCAVECYSYLNCRTFSFSYPKKICLGYIKPLDAYKNNMAADVPEGEAILFQTCEDDSLTTNNPDSSCNESLTTNISDSSFTASTSSDFTDLDHSAYRARLHTKFESKKTGGKKAGGWAARYNNKNQWLQIDLLRHAEIRKITTQGRSHDRWKKQWVTQYIVEYSLDGTKWVTITDTNGADQIFVGNTDTETLVTNSLALPVTARYIKIKPLAWHVHVSMRVGLTGCYV